MAAEVKIDWRTDKVRLVVGEAFDQSIGNIALRIEEHTKINIQDAPGANGQGLVDTGFMLNSVYAVLKDGFSNYDQTNPSGSYTNQEGDPVERRIAPRKTLSGGASALVAVGADYAIFQEIKHAFFFKAIEETSREIRGLIQTF